MKELKYKTGIILARVSSRAQELEGYSLDAQLKFLRAYANNNNIQIVKEYKIAETASKANERKEFHECLEGLEKNGKIDCLIIEKVDRAIRNLKDLSRIDDWVHSADNHELHCVKDNTILTKNSRSQETFVWSIKALVAKNYADNLSEEVQKGQNEKLSQGWYPNRPPIGYKTIKSDGKNIHIIDEEVAPLIRNAFQTYVRSGQTISSVTEAMNKWGVKNINGGKICKSTVDVLLDNKFYIGINIWKGKEYPGAQEHLISDELWKEVQIKKHGGTIDKPKYKKHNALFRGLIKCKHCNRLIVWQKQKGHWYGKCNNKCVSHYAVEDGVLDDLKRILGHVMAKDDKIYDWIQNEIKTFSKHENDQARKEYNLIQSKLNRESGKLDMLYNDKLDGIISTEEYLRRSETLKMNIRNLEEDLKSTNISIESQAETAIKLVSICNRVQDCLDSKNDEIIREVIGFFFKKITWDGNKIAYELSDEAQLVVSFADFAEKQKEKIQPQKDPCKMGSNNPNCLAW